jgi:undecaprenyl diphosphate synthase
VLLSVPKTHQTGKHEPVNAPRETEADATAIAATMRARNPKAEPLVRLPDVHPSRIPRHIAIIMDGNGRWAKERGFPREFGHRNGARVVREIIEEAGFCGVEALTLYSFSMENWKRPAAEVEALMGLCVAYLDGEREHMMREGIRFRVIGRREGLPQPVIDSIERTTRATAHCKAMTLCLAINYSSRTEITDAAREIAGLVATGRINTQDIDESLFASHLYTDGLPDPDLLIRTAGEMRISNYLLWQISYAELLVTPTFWPDFSGAHLRDAIREYARRSRRFGGLDSDAPASACTPGGMD